MSKLTKGLIIGALASGVIVGMWVPIKGVSMIDRIKAKANKLEEEV